MSRRILFALAVLAVALTVTGLGAPDAAASDQSTAQAEVWNVEAMPAVLELRSDPSQRWVAHVVQPGTSEVWSLPARGEVLLRFQGMPPDAPAYVIAPGRWVLYRDAGVWKVGQKPEPSAFGGPR